MYPSSPNSHLAWPEHTGLFDRLWARYLPSLLHTYTFCEDSPSLSPLLKSRSNVKCFVQFSRLNQQHFLLSSLVLAQILWSGQRTSGSVSGDGDKQLLLPLWACLLSSHVLHGLEILTTPSSFRGTTGETKSAGTRTLEAKLNLPPAASISEPAFLSSGSNANEHTLKWS